ncbi:uncharacterized protein LOC135483396 isoform X2 [Lineus longissimus]|uniref:uncharacterized protein LOC135483396 isoform X2 n=1 Tax=Lineus longissimus TaxID=88925 RepID=UPI002B4C5E0E
MTEMTIASLVLLLFACCWPTGEAAAKTYNARTFPSPMLKPTECGMGNNKSFVCDPDYILHRLQATQLNDLIRSKTKSFRCTCKDDCTDYSDKYAMMVAIVTRVDVAQNASMEERKLAVDQFAKDLQERGWAGGNCQNDIVIVLCKEYKMMHAVSGKRIRNFLSDGCLVTMINESSALLTDGFYHKGVYDFVKALSLNIRREDCIQKERTSSNGGMSTAPWVVYVVGGIISIIFMSIVLFGIRRYRRHRRDKRNRGGDPTANVVYRPASRELVDQYEGDTYTATGGYPSLDTSNSPTGSPTRSPIVRSHGGGHHPYEHINSHDVYGQGAYRGGPDGGSH